MERGSDKMNRQTCVLVRLIASASVIGLVAGTGCSVGMALSGKPDPNVSVLNIGMPRQIVLLNLGQPTKTAASKAGRTDVFDLERGNEPSAGRAVLHGVMDVLTLGAWEIIGTPIEGFQGEKFQLTVEYDSDDVVTSIVTGEAPSAPPKPTEATRGHRKKGPSGQR